MIQIDMPMPKCCDECFALDDHGDYPFCLISQDQRGYTFNARENRMPSCPLKEQEPMVLTLEEVHVVEVCWLEEKGYEPFATLEADSWNHNTYNKGWRCWSSMPTDEQRKVVKWNE